VFLETFQQIAPALNQYRLPSQKMYSTRKTHSLIERTTVSKN
jgi:hypothetical protein